MTRTTDYAWAAGLIDGEGCIHVKVAKKNPRWNPYHTLLVLVSMTSKEPIVRLRQIFGVGSLQERKTKTSGGRKIWVYQCAAQMALRVLHKVYPYLVNKRKEARMAIYFQESLMGRKYCGMGISRSMLKRREKCRKTIKRLKRSQ